MSPRTSDPIHTGAPRIRTIEREILLASSGELSRTRRYLLWMRLRFDRDARAYASAERLLGGAIRAPARSRRPFAIAAIVPLAAAAALALAFGLWSRRSAPAPTPGHAPEATVSRALETPLILRTRQLAIEAVRAPRALTTSQLAYADAPKPLSLDLPLPPVWPIQRLDAPLK